MSDGLLSLPEAAEYLNVSYHWLQNQVAARKVPHTRLGRVIRFSPAHLAAIVQAGEQPVASEIPVVMTDTVPRPSRRRRLQAQRS